MTWNRFEEIAAQWAAAPGLMPYGRYYGKPIELVVQDDEYWPYLETRLDGHLGDPPEMIARLRALRSRWLREPSSVVVPALEPGLTRLPFGKWKGWGLPFLLRRDPDYAHWRCRQPFLEGDYPERYKALRDRGMPVKPSWILRARSSSFGTSAVYRFPASRIVRQLQPQSSGPEAA